MQAGINDEGYGPKDVEGNKEPVQDCRDDCIAEGNTMKEKVGMGNEGSYKAPLYTP